MNNRESSFDDIIYRDLSDNPYLLELHDKLLLSYSSKLFKNANPATFLEKKEKKDILCFAEILAQSKDGLHKIWAQQIVSLMEIVFQEDDSVQSTKRHVLQACTNYKGLNNEIEPTGDFLEDISQLCQFNYLKIPGTENDHFFTDQKRIYDSFSREQFSYSAPTSLGKSFIMRVFIKERIRKRYDESFGIVVPTKALISEIKSEILKSFESDLFGQGYRIITNIDDLALERSQKLLYVMTPERLLYLIETRKDLPLDYLFIDEAHKISSKDTRSPYYYDLIRKICSKNKRPHIFFSSPNIPNPEIYLKLANQFNLDDSLHIRFSPVSQVKYLIDMNRKGLVSVYNDFSRKFIPLENPLEIPTLNYAIHKVGSEKQNLIYCQSVAATMYAAEEFAQSREFLDHPELKQLSDLIMKEIHKEYLLVEMVRKGIAFHVGYLPTQIRNEIERLYRSGIITHLFCTSTLIEGVNLPADNLFITSHKIGRANYDEVTFRNLIGRVGRIKFNLFGNVFLVAKTNDAKDRIAQKYMDLLQSEIPSQELSVDKELGKADKRRIVNSILSKDYAISGKPKSTTSNKFELMRKFLLILKNDIHENVHSAIVDAFAEELDEEKILKIQDMMEIDNKSIVISPDQYKSLKDAIEKGEHYPEPPFDKRQVTKFLSRLANIFQWETYERSTLGKKTKEGELGFLNYYAILLLNWMNGEPLAKIIDSGIKHHENHPENGVFLGHWKVSRYYETYNKQHKNYVIADTLNILDHVILFQLMNYLREFSSEFRNVRQISGHFPNDWCDYVEYGTQDRTLILLQQSGFDRKTAKTLKERNLLDFDYPSPLTPFTIKKDEIEKEADEELRNQAREAMINLPELFS